MNPQEVAQTGAASNPQSGDSSGGTIVRFPKRIGEGGAYELLLRETVLYGVVTVGKEGTPISLPLFFQESERNSESPKVFNCNSDENGFYSITLPAPQLYYLSSPERPEVSLFSSRIYLAGRTTKRRRDLHFSGVGILSIQFLDSHHHPCPGTEVFLIGLGGKFASPSQSESGPDGRWTVQLPSGQFELRAWNSNLNLHGQKVVVVRENETTEARMPLAPAFGFFRGRVVDKETREVIAGARVTILPQGVRVPVLGPNVERTNSRPTGDFSVPIGAEGTFSLESMPMDTQALLLRA